MTREQKGKALYERWVAALAKVYKHTGGSARKWEDMPPKEKEVWMLTVEEEP